MAGCFYLTQLLATKPLNTLMVRFAVQMMLSWLAWQGLINGITSLLFLVLANRRDKTSAQKDHRLHG